MKRFGKFSNRCLVIGFILIIWQFYVTVTHINPILFPSILDVLKSIFILFQDISFYQDIAFTLIRTIGSFLIAIILFIPLGLIMGIFPKVYNHFEFLIEFFRSIPATALLPLFLLFFGIGEKSKIFLGAWTAGLILLINTMYSVHNTKTIQKNMAKTFKLSKITYLKKIVLPESLPIIFGGIRVAISLSLVIIIVSEIFNSNIGLGSRLIDAQLSYRTAELFGVIILIGLMGYLLSKIILIVERKVIFWKGY
jgi:NitT/TauT family transport system permease protein